MITRVSFVAGTTGGWAIEEIRAIRGEPLATAARIARIEGEEFAYASGAAWVMHGVRSHDRYVSGQEQRALASASPALDRADASCAVLIPLRKSEAWWKLAQGERREIFEERSRHLAIGSDYLPAIARRLYHCHDLGGPFDFLTFFEHAPSDRGAFDELVGRLRESEEWRYVDREVEIRLSRGNALDSGGPGARLFVT